jgi:hypothetical protein
MTKREDQVRARRLHALAVGEQNVLERLAGIRAELDVLTRSLDRLVVTSRPRLHAGGGSLGNVVRLTHRLRGF